MPELMVVLSTNGRALALAMAAPLAGHRSWPPNGMAFSGVRRPGTAAVYASDCVILPRSTSAQQKHVRCNGWLGGSCHARRDLNASSRFAALAEAYAHPQKTGLRRGASPRVHREQPSTRHVRWAGPGLASQR